MNTKPVHNPVIFTNKARCRDCYRCLRVCPVKAIRMHDGQAQVIAERCIACGTCVRECPQGAKVVRCDLARAQALLTERPIVAVSIAPSFAAAFEPAQARRLASALRKLGFGYVAETAVGAGYVAQRTAQIAAECPGATVCSACPAVVNYIERYAPHLTGALAGVVSPMVAHARALKAQLGPEAGVVFIGPCVAKKEEAQRPGCEAVDCVLTFQELREWLDREKIDLRALEESGVDEAPASEARAFAVSGGLARAASLSTDLLDEQVMAVHGPAEVLDALAAIAQGRRRMLIDPLLCSQGCVNGPALDSDLAPFQRRLAVLEYARTRQAAPVARRPEKLILDASFVPRPIGPDKPISQEQIRRVLASPGKADPADQLNCGACGYDTCRDKAIAVLAGMAEVEMCIPTMRRLAEQRGDRIIDSSPNGIVILNQRLEILSMNPAFRKMFVAGDAVLGKRISYLLDPEPFELLAAGRPRVLRDAIRHEKYGLTCREIYYRLGEEDQFVGLFVDITDSLASQNRLSELRAQTAAQARELLEHQLALAQTITRQLGESTAKGELLAEQLMALASEKTR